MLKERIGDLPWVGQIRGLGLFIGVEIVADRKTMRPFAAEQGVTAALEARAFENGLMILGGVTGLIDGVAGDHFELLPPYTVEDEHLLFMADTLNTTLQQVMSELL